MEQGLGSPTVIALILEIIGLLLVVAAGVYKFGQQGQRLDAAVTEIERMKESHPMEMHERDMRRKEEREQLEAWHKEKLELVQANYDQKIAATQEQLAQAIRSLEEGVKSNRELFQIHITDSQESRADIKVIREDVSEVKEDMSGVKATLTAHVNATNGHGYGGDDD